MTWAEDTSSHPGWRQAATSYQSCPSSSQCCSQREQPRGAQGVRQWVLQLWPPQHSHRSGGTASLRTTLTDVSRKSPHMPARSQVQDTVPGLREPMVCKGGKIVKRRDQNQCILKGWEERKSKTKEHQKNNNHGAEEFKGKKEGKIRAIFQEYIENDD